jgi:hypothetical protein
MLGCRTTFFTRVLGVLALGLIGLQGCALSLPATAAPGSEPTPEVSTAGPGLAYLPLINRYVVYVRGWPLTNLLANSQFESGDLQGWEAGGATASSAQAHTGHWSARAVGQAMRTFVATTPGRSYKVTAWIKIASQTGTELADPGRYWPAPDGDARRRLVPGCAAIHRRRGLDAH